MAYLGACASMQPSIKGSALTSTVEDVQKLVQAAPISENELEQRLTRAALALVRGEEISERRLQAGLYAQLDFVKRSKLDPQPDPKARCEAFGRDPRLINTLSGSMFNFGHWSSGPDSEHEGRYVIEIHEATALPVPTRLATEGFLNRPRKEMSGAAR